MSTAFQPDSATSRAQPRRGARCEDVRWHTFRGARQIYRTRDWSDEGLAEKLRKMI